MDSLDLILGFTNSILEHQEYEGPLKPCPKCGSDEVMYYVLGTYKRLGCRACNCWLTDRPEPTASTN
jgi:hypothetical protein